MIKKALALAVVLTIFLAGCGSDSGPAPTTTQAPAAKLRVVVTSTQLADFVKVVGGNDVELTVLAAPNRTISGYQLGPDGVTALARADVVIRTGVGLDPWLDEALGSGTLQDASEGVSLENRTVNGTTGKDPYYWMSPVNARIMVANVADVLSKRDPSRADRFRSNERAYSAQLDSLRRDTQRTLASLVAPKIVTSSNNFAYYAKEFGITYLGSVEATPQADLVSVIQAQKLRSVFTDNTSAAGPSFAVASAAGVKALTGNDVLYIESLGPEGSDASTYLEAMRHNADVLVANLG